MPLQTILDKDIPSPTEAELFQDEIVFIRQAQEQKQKDIKRQRTFNISRFGLQDARPTIVQMLDESMEDSFFKDKDGALLFLKAEYKKLTGRDLNELSIFFSRYRKFIINLSCGEFFFFRQFVSQYGFLDPKMINLMSGKRFVLEFGKSGSRLHVFTPLESVNGSDRNISIVNVIPEESAQIWRQVAEHNNGEIPVAPIYGFGKRKFGNIVVFSRFCGLSFDLVYEALMSCPFLYGECKRQMNEIMNNLKKLKIVHGNIHDGNFVVELIDKQYYENQIKAGQNINTIDWQAGKFSYEIADYEKDSEKWKVVVRLIDWDQAKYESD